MKKIIIFMAIVAMVSGCAQFKQLTGTKPYPECNESISNDSVLKNIAIAHEVCLEDVGNALIMTNAFLIGREVYTREQALEVVNKWMAMLEIEKTTYQEFRKEVYNQVKKYPGLFEIAEIYFLHFSKITAPILPEDRKILTVWLNERVIPLLQGVE